MIAAFDHPFLSGLLGDDDMAVLLGIEAEIAAMLTVESALTSAQAQHGIIAPDAASVIDTVLKQFQPDMAGLKAGVMRDGVVVPELVRQLKSAVGEPNGSHVHFGATSQDVIDTALVLRLAPCLDLLEARLIGLVAGFDRLSDRFGGRSLIGRTRMQAAIPITVAGRLEAWREPLSRHIERLASVRGSILVVQFGGAAGTLEKLGDKGPAIRATLAERVGLADVPQWHSQRDRVADVANWLSLVTGSLGKFGQDVALMAQDGGEIELAGGGGSSAMAHKQNPVDAEALVTLARFNATQLSGMHHAIVHEQERSGAAWTLEWLILPQMIMAAGAATLLAARLTGNIRSLGSQN